MENQMSMSDHFLTFITQKIENNISNENFSVSDLAREAGLNRSTLHRRLIRLTGKSATELITEIRLSRARELLENDAATVSEIAYEVGFKSPSYFIRLFKKAYQVTPGDVRKKGSGILKIPITSSESDKLDPARIKRSRSYVRLRLIYFVGVIAAALAVISILSTIIRINQVNKLKDFEKLVAVLPFHNLTGDDEQDFICSGLADEIISHLSKVRSFDKVVSFASVSYYKGSERDIPGIAEELGVNYVLDGTFKKMEEEYKITVQLIEVRSDNPVWTYDYSIPFEEVIGIPGEVALQIAMNLNAFMTDDEKQNIQNQPTKNLQAYNLYLQGRHCYAYIGGKEGIDESIKFYNQALEKDPNFALAYSALAASYSDYAAVGLFPRSLVMEQAKDAAQMAIKIDHSLGEAHAELAWTRIYQDFAWEEGEKELRYALQLNPNYAKGHLRYSLLLTFTRRHEEAITEVKRAMALDPLSSEYWMWLGRMYLYARKYDLAIEELNRYHSNYPDSDYCLRYLSMACLQEGMKKEALETLSKVDSKGKDPLDGYIYGLAGETEKAREVLNYRLALSRKRYVNITDFTMIYAGLGEYDKALDSLEQAFERREGWLMLLQVEPMYDSLRNNPRFKAIQEKMNFPSIR